MTSHWLSAMRFWFLTSFGNRGGVAVKWSSIPALLVLALVAGCSSTSTTETELTSSGPCVDGFDRVSGESGLTVEAGADQVSAALGFEELEYCPGHDYAGQVGLSADGFLATLDETVVHAEPGSTITVNGPGYPGAKLRAGLEMKSDVLTFDNERVWELLAPEEPGRYEVDLFLDWDEGKAHYAFVAVVPGAIAGPAVLETTNGGLLAKLPDGGEVYFHLDGPAQGYGDGSGGLVYQSLNEQRWVNNIDVMWLGAADALPKTVVAAGSSSIQLQGVSDGQVLTVQAAITDTDGVLSAGTRQLLLTNIESGRSTTLLSFGAESETGIGRASMFGDRIVVSLRSLECTWFEFMDGNGQEVTIPDNPRPRDARCGGPLATGAVLLDDGRLAYVETENGLEYAFDHPDGFAFQHVIFSRPPVQEIVIVDLDTGAEEGRIPIEPIGTVVWWLEPVPGGLVASLAQLGDGLGGEIDQSSLPMLPRAPDVGDLGSDHGGGHVAGSISVSLGGPDIIVVASDSLMLSAAENIRQRGLCSAALSDMDFGPPSGVTGLGEDVPVVTHEMNAATRQTRAAIVSAASQCDYHELADLAVLDRDMPSFFSGPGIDRLAAYWMERENAGFRVLAGLVELLEYPPTGSDPFHWDGIRGDMVLSTATVTIDDDGRWIGFQDR